MREPIEWCREQYQRFPNFRFQHADVYNKHYNQGGKVGPERFRFPYADNRFDVVVLTSVFTHLLPEGMSHYLGEVARVLKHGGRCFVTYFLLNAESSARVDQWMKQHPDERDRGVPGGLGFRWEYDERCRVFDREVPETAVAYSEDWLTALYAGLGLEVERVQYGEWCRRSFQPGWQDGILAVKGSLR
jgi:SAM-dependent methyltransferase